MKSILRLLPLLLAALLLGACSTINSRINEKAPVFYGLDPAVRAQIAHGDVGIGFTPDMVYIALGRPDVKYHRVAQGGQAEVWIYRSYYDEYDGIAHVGYHRWYAGGPRGYRVYWEPVYTDVYSTVASDDIRVVFKDGKVTIVDRTVDS
jgi:hypothetical protein